MKVYSIDNKSCKNTYNFKSCLRRYKPQDVNSKILANGIVRTSTNFFREDLNWKFFIKYLVFNFLDSQKVNIYSLASSDGSEAYSLAMMLLTKFPEQFYKKFLPIQASDIDAKVIESARKHKINLYDFEFDLVNKNYNINMKDYFTKSGSPVIIPNNDCQDYDKLSSYVPSDELKSTVQFKQSDILTELSQIKDEGNSVVMCRNVMPYLKEDYFEKVVYTAGKQLKSGSLFIAGEYDSKACISTRLHENGFFRPYFDDYNIFQKK